MLTEFYRNENVPLRNAFGGEYPEFFLHPAAEYRALTRECGVIDLTHWRIISIRGRDRARFLNAMLTNDVSPLDSGRGVHSMFTTVKGKILAEIFVFPRGDEYLGVVPQGDFAAALGDLNKHIIADDVTIEDVSASFGMLAVEGPESKEMRKRLLEPGPFPKSPLEAVERNFERFSIFVMQNSATGEAGFHLLAPAGEIARVRDYLVQAARGSDGLPVGYVAWNIRRVECGLPWYGIDFSGDNFPQEARLGAAVSYTKGCFRGQETLARLEHRGHVNRLLVGLVPEESALSVNERARFEEIARLGETLAGEELRPQATSDAEALEIRGFLPAGSPLYRAGSSNETASSNALACGVTTSAVYSFALRRPLVMAYVRREALDEPLAARTTRGEMRLREVALPPPQESANR